ncbi:MAG TPA: phenylalanine--tRNA ligase subunit alpha [Candidatus Nanoarchaeia archaeon]|nr:phenylalanine--tRNA ligase subunit alpha [Candidatus Nanoarchaeia archaeon]
MEETKSIVESLHPLERKIVPLLKKFSLLSELVNESDLSEVEIMRALQWLGNRNILSIEDNSRSLVSLDVNGEKYLKNGFPEKLILKALSTPKNISQIKAETVLSDEEINVSIGILRKRHLAEITKENDGKGLMLKISEEGKKFLEEEYSDENFVRKKFPLWLDSLGNEEKNVLEELKKRKQIIKIYPDNEKKILLSELGRKIVDMKIKENVIDRLSQQIIRSGEWERKSFRRYDIKINVPKIFGGRKQHYRRFLDEVRQKFVSLGFTEMTGPIVETDFWNMDALFMPQFHSARDIHDAYYVKEPKFADDIPEELLKRVKSAHETGFGTGSRGWQYTFDISRTKRHLLRTQGTACSARMLASKNLKIPGKYFGITRCFRYDLIDATHNCDFYQTEGIVVEEEINIKHLFGLLKMFAKEFAEADKIKISPGYFPFTEPSCELFAKHPELGWIELGGAGIFRPELVKPLIGREVPVLAWGIGIDRLAMFKLGLSDIRQLFSHDLEFLRKTKVII